MRHIEPKFDSPETSNHNHNRAMQNGNFPHDTNQGESIRQPNHQASHQSNHPQNHPQNYQQNNVQIKNPQESAPENAPENVKAKPVPQKAKQYGTSVGWGWFQGFSLFATFLLFAGSVGLLWLMVGNDPIHTGPPKYILNNEIQIGDAVQNSLLTNKDIVQNNKNMNQNPGENDQIIKDASNNIVLIGQSESDNAQTTPTNQKSEADQQLEEINLLLASGANALKQVKLTTPENDSAYFYYTQVLAISPNNATAKSGIIETAKRYANLVSRDIERGNITSASKYLTIGLKLDPNSQQLLQFKADIESLVN